MGKWVKYKIRAREKVFIFGLLQVYGMTSGKPTVKACASKKGICLSGRKAKLYCETSITYVCKLF